MRKKPGNASASLFFASLLIVMPLTLRAEDGAALFRQHCMACHGEHGAGAAGLAPPLQNAELWGALGKDSTRYILAVMRGGLSGAIRAQGVDYIGLAMPPQAHLKPEEREKIARYVLETLNDAPRTDIASALEAEIAEAPLSHKTLRLARNGKSGLFSHKVVSK
jgi:mono/diheme cytochrome c family protein